MTGLNRVCAGRMTRESRAQANAPPTLTNAVFLARAIANLPVGSI